MRPNIDFEECLKDSPRFRASLEDAENDVDVLEAKVEKLMKLCGGMIEAGKQFNTANSAFIIGLRELADYFKDDELASDDSAVAEALEKFTRVLTELQKYQNILLDQAHRSICKNLSNFIKNDIKRVKETRKHFEKISDDMDSALVKNSQAMRSRPQECEDANNVLTAMRRCFAHNSLDYVFQINVLHSKKRFDILDTMLAFMHAQSTYFHQGYDLFEDLDPFVKQVASRLQDLHIKADARRKEMEERHALVQGKEVAIYATPSEIEAQSLENAKKEGYLFKRTSNAFKTWVRRWFSIENNQLVYRKRSKDTLTIMEEDLRLCTVKPVIDSEKRFCFEVLSPTRSHMLQADSDQDCQDWVMSIQDSVSHAYNRQQSQSESLMPSQSSSTNLQDSSSSDTRSTSSAEATIEGPESKDKIAQPEQKVTRMQQILAVAGNAYCCDCGSPEPRWASINLGISLCIECSGIHRGLGVHMSKVRSMTLDAWEHEQLKVMLEIGNDTVNSIYEANVSSGAVRATPHCSRETREQWIRKKYVEKAFIKTLPKTGEVKSPIKKWTVSRVKRRSPLRTVPSPTKSTQPQDTSVPQAADLAECNSTSEILIFGTQIPTEATHSSQAIAPIAELDDSDDSVSETEGDDANADAKSTTSTEDLSTLTPDLLLYKATQARNLAVMLEALAHGANPNWHSANHNGRTPLIAAIEGGSMATVEFLLVNGAKVDQKDDHAMSPLHHATLLGHTGQVCQLLKRNANQHAIDMNGMDPLSIAVKNANADIVTLLRLAKLNEEMRETEGLSGQGDETFNEVFRDFTNMANNAPEKLNRKK